MFACFEMNTDSFWATVITPAKGDGVGQVK